MSAAPPAADSVAGTTVASRYEVSLPDRTITVQHRVRAITRAG